MSRLLAISADLSAPPSEASCYRDVSMYAHIFLHYDVVATVTDATLIDPYAIWFRRFGLWDFVDDLVLVTDVTKEATVEIECCAPHGRLTTFNLSDVLAAIPR